MAVPQGQAGGGRDAGDLGSGTLTTAARTWTGSGGYTVMLASDTAGDQLVMTGMTIAATPANPFTILPPGTATAGSDDVIATVNAAATDPFAAALGSSPILSLTTTQPAGGGTTCSCRVAVPEPASPLLLGIAAAPLAVGRRRPSW